LPAFTVEDAGADVGERAGEAAGEGKDNHII
jgi:hypothetical protein